MQILNKPTLALSLIILTLVLGGCSSMPSMPKVFGSDDNNDANVSTNSEASSDEALTKDLSDGEALALTPEELEQQALAIKARELMASINGFSVDKQSQKRLNSSQLANIQSAISALGSQDTDTALSEVQRVIDDPDFVASPHSAVWVLRGDIHATAKDTEQAILDYQAAIAISTNNYQAHNRLGQLYRDNGEFEQARKHYDLAVMAWPGNASTYRNRGILFDLYIGDKKAALADYKLYKALLDLQVESVELPAKSLLKEQRLAGQWITDIKRQIKAIEREQTNA